jgi:hypothetical protein
MILMRIRKFQYQYQMDSQVIAIPFSSWQRQSPRPTLQITSCRTCGSNPDTKLRQPRKPETLTNKQASDRAQPDRTPSLKRRVVRIEGRGRRGGGNG